MFDLKLISFMVLLTVLCGTFVDANPTTTGSGTVSAGAGAGAGVTVGGTTVSGSASVGGTLGGFSSLCNFIPFFGGICTTILNVIGSLFNSFLSLVP